MLWAFMINLIKIYGFRLRLKREDRINQLMGWFLKNALNAEFWIKVKQQAKVWRVGAFQAWQWLAV